MRKPQHLFLACFALLLTCAWLAFKYGNTTPPDEREPISKQRVLGPVVPTSATGAVQPQPEDSSVAASKEAASKSGSKKPSTDSLPQFSKWTERYLKATPAERTAMEDEGIQLAEARRPAFKEMIRENPREAIATAVPMVVRQKLPQRILSLLEERVNGVGALRVYRGRALTGEPVVKRVAEMKDDGKFYSAHVYGRRAEIVTWTPGASLNGVAIDHDLAVTPEPFRVLEIGEIPNPAKPMSFVCPVSGKRAATEEETKEPVGEDIVVVESATETLPFCDGSHITIYRDTLIMAEGSSGGAFGFTGILPAVPTPSIGVVRVLYMPVTFADQNGVPCTEASAYDTMRDVGDYYAKSSFGKLTLVTAVTPPIKLPHTEAWYVQRDTSNGGDIDGEGMEHSHARNEARLLGFDDANYDCVVMRHTGGPGSYGGLGGGSSVWIRGGPSGSTSGVTAHEVGHCFGLAHANYWDTAGTSAIGSGANAEYGDQYDVMGSSGSFPNGHYNSQAKNQIKWLPSNFVENITQSGQYRLYAFDQPTLDATKRYALNITKDSQKVYWGELRQVYDGSASNPWADKGMLLGWRYPNGSGSNIQLIDTTPGSPFAKDDAPISLGQTFSDTESGIHITTLAVSSGVSPKYVDVMVNLGQFAGNQAPTLALSASADVVPVGGTVTFTASASDADGDPIAYSWQHFGDTSFKKVEANSNTITRTFSTSPGGTYVVTCTASDMKGGSVTRSKLITVGTGNGRSTISGRITLLGQGLPNVTVTANGANGVVTDSDGYYTIPNLTATTYSMTPLLYGYSFGELFNNAVAVGPNFTGADFEATANSVVSIAASTPLASELAPVTAGKFTITRTGDISQDLLVNVNTALGTATKTTDYVFAPDYVAGSQGFSTFTIPADYASVDVVVTPAVDATAEGPETVTLQIGPGNGYVVAGSSTATVTIDDDDTALPKISLTALVASLNENAVAAPAFKFTSSKPPAADLVINYTTAGTATSATDFAVLSGTATITAGTTSTTVNVAPVNDAVSESLETLRLQTSTNAAYLVDPAATSITINLVDDDAQTVNVTATDATAAEVDLTVVGAQANTGTFLVTRSGDISQPLTVYYSTAGTYNTGVPALHGVDYEALPGVLIIPAGQSSASVTILPRFDGIGEGNELVVFELGAGPSNYVVGANALATVTITDSATDLPVVEVEATVSAVEGSTNGTFRLSARGSGTGNLVVNFNIGGTATRVSDFTITTSSTLTFDTATGNGTATLTLANGVATTKDITITQVNDADAELLETVVFTITSAATYQTFAPTASASMWLRDDDQPTVFVDTQVGTSGTAYTVTEGTVSTPTKFWISRTGTTTSALTVNYTLGGTATSGTDYTGPTGSISIPIGATSVDLPLVITNDAVFEGTETVRFEFAAGSYATGPGATMFIADNETSAQTVAFSANSSRGPESTTTVNIPVTLASAATAPVTVDYEVSSGTRAATTASYNQLTVPQWVRITRSGTTFDFYDSTDGVTWIQRRTPSLTNSISTASYLVGLAVGSTNATNLATAVFDNVTVTDIAAGGSVGALVQANIGTPAPAASSSELSGVYTVASGGTGISSSSTTDTFRFVYFPVTNSTTCTLTARLVSHVSADAGAKAGVMIRESTATNSRFNWEGATPVGSNYYGYRTSTGGNASISSAATAVILPYWVRVQRAGSVFSSWRSQDGAAWTQIGSNQTMDLPSEVLAGLAVSSRSDGTISTATFDNVTFSSPPSGTLQGRTVGFVNEQGSDSAAGGVYTVNGSGSGLNSSSQDECHFVAAPISGDFTLSARVLSQTNGNSNKEAGVMIRENASYRSRMIYCGAQGTSGLEMISRNSTFTSSFAAGVDYLLPGGTLNFAIGEQTKNITFTVTNDLINEPNENLSLLLRNPNGAILGALSQHTYTIEDDDLPPANPYVGFAAATSGALEASGTANILVSLSTPATIACSVDYSVTGGTATGGGADYTLASGTVNFAAGDSVAAIPVTLIDDATDEGDETVIVTLTNAQTSQLGSVFTHTFTITNDDKPTVTIVANDANAAEAGLDPGQFTITRTGPTTAALNVSLARTGTATSGSDFTAITTPLTVTIPIGQSSTTLNVVPLGDSTNEGGETVIETISANSAYVVGSPGAATVTIADDDRSTVTITATDSGASETAGNTATFTITRTAPTNVALTVNLLAPSGTATSGTDYTALPTIVSFVSGDVSKTVTLTPLEDSITEGPEVVSLKLNTGSYDIGGVGYDDVTIADNDNPPTLFIDGPTAQGPLVASGNGIIVSATVTDDGAPQPVALQWSLLSGPGTATFDSATSASTGVTFSADGNYVLRVTATDGQFTVSDQVTVIVGGALGAANWLSVELNPTPARRGAGTENGGVFTISGTGGGYGATSDSAYVMCRQAGGDSSIVVRLTSLATGGATAPFAGIMIRDQMIDNAARAVLGYVPGVGLQFRKRLTAGGTETTTDTVASVTTLPVWLKLQRNATTNEITASYAPDVAGVAGAYTAIGSPAVVVADSAVELGMTTTASNTGFISTGVFDNVTLTPSPAGPAVLIEDLAANPSPAGSSSFSAGTYTIAGGPNATQYYLWQYYGDLMITAKHATATSGAGSARSGIVVRESTSNGANALFGRIPTGSYNGYSWTSIAGGGGGGVPAFTGATRWVRIIRKGNAITAFHAADVSGSPGAWAQVGQPQTVIMTTPVLVGFYVNNSSGVGLNTVTFNNLSIVPLNKAPVVDAGTVPASPVSPLALNATVTDDNYPAPVSLTTLWAKLSGPGAVTFGNSALIDTSATFVVDGSYKFRLLADDGSVQAFDDLVFNGYSSAYSAWQGAQFSGGSSNANAAMLLDPDSDGQCNLLEYALGTDPETSAPSNVAQDAETISSSKYLRLTVTKNPAATDVNYEVQATSNLADANSWTSVGLVTEINTSTQLRVRDNVAITPGQQRFMRVRVSK